MAAVVYHNLEGFRALVSCDRLNLEKGLNANNATALLVQKSIAGSTTRPADIER